MDDHDKKKKATTKHDRSSIKLMAITPYEEETTLDQRQVTVEIEDSAIERANSMIRNRRIIDVITDQERLASPSSPNHTQTDMRPLIEYANEPLLPLAEACVPLESIIFNISFYVQMALRETPKKPSDRLTIDESAAIRLYTIEWQGLHPSLYSQLNYTLNNGDREALRPYFKYMKLFLTGLVKLPFIPPSTVWRGVTKNLSEKFPPGTPVTWYTFSSCTTQLPVLESSKFLGQNGDRTLFSVEVINGRSIRKHSHFDNEDEVLLLPGTHMIVQSQLSPASNLYVIHLKQVIPKEVLLKPPFEGAHLYLETITTFIKPHWYHMKRIIIPIFLLIIMAIVAIILGSVLGTKSTNNVTSINNQTVESPFVVRDYSSTLTSFSLSYCRTGTGTCAGYSYYYEATQLSVSKTGSYIIKSSNSGGMNTYGYIYNNIFDESDPAANLLQANNDVNMNNQQFQLNLTLLSSSQYMLVVTTYEHSVTGSFTILAYGPGSVNFAQTATSTNYLGIYSSQINGSSSEYCRNTSCTGLLTYHYEAITLTVSTSGYYVIRSNSTFDSYGYIYSTSFNPSYPNFNLIQENNDDSSSDQFLLNMSLTSSTQYVLVITTKMPNVTGSFLIIITGSGSVHFSQADVVYSYIYSLQLTNSSPSYCRYTENQCPPGTFYYYKDFLLTVLTSGYYKIKSNSNNGFDTYGFLYNNSFNSTRSNVNQISSNDDGAGYGQFELNYYLEASMSYIMVVTTYLANDTGLFSLIGTGPDLIYVFQNYITYSYIYSSELTTSSSYYYRYRPSELLYYYKYITVSVSTTGYYIFTSNSTFDTYGLIYKNKFDTSDPSANLLQENYNGNGYNQFLLKIFLQTSVPYVLVVTTLSTLSLGSFSVNGTGPGLARMT